MSDDREAVSAGPQVAEAWFVLDGSLNVQPCHWKGWTAVGLLGLVLATIAVAADWASTRLTFLSDGQIAAAALATMLVTCGMFRISTNPRTVRAATR